MDQKAVVRFLRRQFFVPRPEGACVRLECWHLGTSRKTGAPTWDENFNPHQQVDESAVDRLADDIDKATQDEADQLDGVQQYMILGYREHSGDRPVARFPIRQTCSVDNEDNPSLQSEPANLGGICAQQMRHNEALVRTSVGGWREMISIMQKTLARQSDTIENLIAQRQETFATIEEAQSGKALREAEAAERQAREKRQDALIETFLPLVPAVVNMVSGRKLLPEKTTPERQMVVKFMETISPEQFQQMRGILDPEQYGIIATMLADIQGGIDSNLPGLFKRLLESMPETQASRLQQEVFNMGQVMAIRTMIESFSQVEAARQAEAASAKGGNGTSTVGSA